MGRRFEGIGSPRRCRPGRGGRRSRGSRQGSCWPSQSRVTKAVVLPLRESSESAPEARAVAQVLRVANHLDGRELPEQFRGPVGGTVVHD